MTVTIEPGSSMDLVDLIEALKNVALIVPLPNIIKSIKQQHRF
jgi:hypothetical protein